MKKNAAVEVEMEDLDITGLEVEEVDPIEAEISAVEAEKAEKKGKKESKKDKAPKGEGLASTRALGEDEVGVAYIANLLGIDQRVLRGFLRAKYRNMETSKSQRYSWKKDDPQVQEIIDAYRAKASAPRQSKTEKALDKAEVIEAQIEEANEIDLDNLDIEEA